MRRAWRELRRAPGRIVASIFAIALAVGAVGVLAVPKVSESSLHAAVARDGLADITLFTTGSPAGARDAVAQLEHVTAADRELDVGATLGERDVRAVGLDLRDHQLDLLQLQTGREPAAAGEVVVSPGVAAIGDTIELTRGDRSTQVQVVGIGSTVWWANDDAVFGEVDDLAARLAPDGANRIVLTTSPDDIDTLRTTADRAREVLRAQGVALTAFPITLPDDTTPIDDTIRQISTMIGMLGAVAGVVALVLLGSTTSTLITERTREVAVMRALGSRARPLRRRLRRLAVGIAATALLFGLPLGVLIANLIARMVLEKFVGITPDIAVDWTVVAVSTVVVLVGARLVSAQAARRVTSLPLAEALRDREGAPFGRRLGERLVSRTRLGGLRSRIATRSWVQRRGRTLSLVAQLAAGVGALMVTAGLARSIDDSNVELRTSWTWDAQALADDAGLPFRTADVEAQAPGLEAGVYTVAEIDDRELEVYGLRADPAYFTPPLARGRWLTEGRREAVMSDVFAHRRGIDPGESFSLDLATGPAEYTLVGTLHDGARAVYLDRAEVAGDLGVPGMANVVWTDDASSMPALAAPAEVKSAAQVAVDDEEGSRAIVSIFGAIAAIVAIVGLLAMVSTITVNLFERRHELATLQALGATRRHLRGMLLRELLPLGAAGVALGILAGHFGSVGIMAAIESSEEFHLPRSFAGSAVAPLALGAAVCLVLLARNAVRRTGRRSIAVVLRGAA